MTNTKTKTLVVGKDGLYIGEKKLTTFIPHVKEVREILTSDGPQMSFLISVFLHGNQITTVTVPKLFIGSWFALSRQCPDASLSKQARKLIEEFLEGEAAKLPILREILLDKSGWHNFDSGTIFYRKEIITDKVSIPIQSGKKVIKIVGANEYYFDTDKCSASLQIIDRVAPGTSWILYMASYFDVLKHLFYQAGYPIQFIFNIYGRSGSGKTSLIKAICSPSQVFSFRSSKRRDTILREIGTYGGHTILVDDYHPAESNTDRDRQAGLKDSLVRAVEETADFPNIMISSEYLDGHTSLQDREIQLFLDENLDWKLLETLQNHQETLENIRIGFYSQVVSHAETIIGEIKQFCVTADNNRAVEGKKYFRSNRYADYICFTDYLFHKYFLKKYEIDCLLHNIETDLQSQLNRQEQHMDIIKSLEQKGTYLVALRDMLLCRDIFEQIPDWNEFVPTSKTIHVDSHGIVSVSPRAIRRGMMIYLQSHHVPMKQIVKELSDAEALILYEKGNEYTQKHKGKRIYKIDTEALCEYCSFFE